MKNITKFIQESIKIHAGNAFKEKVTFTAADFDKWKSSTPSENFEVYDDKTNGIALIYKSASPMMHVATYKYDDQMLMCDDLKIFGIEK